MPAPHPTPVYRMIHLDNLSVCLQRGGLHAPNHSPDDGLVYRTIHREDVQTSRRVKTVPCGPGGTVHDYVPFYFGTRSPMLLQLHTGQVPGYGEGQDPLVYLVVSAQGVAAAGLPFVFTDGHGLAAWTEFYDDLADLERVPWDAVDLQWWNDTNAEPDRQRRKQAEFLVHGFVPWDQVRWIAVRTEEMKTRVQAVLDEYPADCQKKVLRKPSWYY